MSSKKVYLIVVSIFLSLSMEAQSISSSVIEAYRKLVTDSTMKYASIGLLVIDYETHDTIISRNERTGLAPASTQKLFTSIAGFELLGSSYTYQTTLAYEGKIEKGILNGNLLVMGSGDPTLGSWRWNSTRGDKIVNDWLHAIRKAGIIKVRGGISGRASIEYKDGIPGGWIWDDIGNYYGAGSYVINWRENQYDLILQSDNQIGGKVKVIDSKPSSILKRNFRNELKAAEKGSGDNAYIYYPVVGNTFLLKGTIPIGEKNFTISGASHDPGSDLLSEIRQKAGNITTTHVSFPSAKQAIIHTTSSPVFDSINYWFMKKSINLYGEALIKTIAFQKTGIASTETGIDILKEFWDSKKIDKESLQILDGSGLSPQNRVTVSALVEALYYAKKQSWFPSFYNSLPVINKMTMKSGSIGGARSYAGYHTSTTGKNYIFAIIVNNYSGSSSAAIKKMFALLDLLK